MSAGWLKSVSIREFGCLSMAMQSIIKHVYHSSEWQTCICAEVPWLLLDLSEEYPRCFECVKAVRSAQNLVGMPHGGGRPGLRWFWFMFRVLFEAD